MQASHLSVAPGCAAIRAGRLDRRRLLAALAAAGLGAALPGAARSAEGEYDAMLLSCIDPRFVTPVYRYMQGQGLAGKYSQFCIAGAAIAVVAAKFAAWRPAFWDNTQATLQLHRINRIIAIDHRDCGAARIAYGAASIATPEAETETHKRALAEFRRAVGEHHPGLTVVTGLMALDGSIEIFS
jgi:carbonic anhydrase